jgi:hypothetical protein
VDPWRNGLDDVRALGIVVDQDQVDTLEHGGEVLVIQCLPEPGCYIYAGEHLQAHDQWDEPVMVASILRSYPVGGIAPSDFARQPGVETMYDLLDADLHSHWRFWPSFTGHFDDANIAQPYAWYADSLSVFRMWDGIPTQTCTPLVARRVVEACNERISRSSWYEMDAFISLMEEYGEVPDPESNPDAEYEESELEMLQLSKQLEADGLWNRVDGYYTGSNLSYPKMDHVLIASNPIDQEALATWDLLEARSKVGAETALSSIPTGDYRRYIYDEQDFNPWL